MGWGDSSTRRQVLQRWNDTARDYPREAAVHLLFAARAAAAPEAVALAEDGGQITYRELDRRANRLAHHLMALGARPGDRVGVLLERSAEAVISFLAILKVGAAYVPFDPESPPRRLALMIEEVGLTVVVTCRELRSRCDGMAALRRVCVEDDAAAIAGRPSGSPGIGGEGGDLAYVLFTSGSTGRPKGVAIPHRGIGRLVLNTDYIELGPGVRMGHASSCTFDPSTFEIWGALLHGARLVVIAPRYLRLPRQLVGHLRAHRVDALWLTVPLFNLLVQEEPTALAGLDTVLVGGQALSPRWVRHALRRGRPRRLLNGYGPTENTTFTTWYPIQEVAKNAAAIPIGRPLANTRVHVLGADGEPAAVGVTGELYTAGDGLALGYWKRPRRTAEAFLPDPFAVAPGERLYRIGDLGRWRPDGNLEFLGRIDHQVKIRGYRIELGEVEAALAGHPSVAEAAVVTREEAPGELGLVGYAVARPGSALDFAEVRTFLGERLPAYMVPGVFVELAAMPLNPSMKVDRRRLPPPPEQRHEEGRAYAAPRSRLEEELAGAFAELLGLERVGVDDNLFELGGHSLLATRLASRLRGRFGIELELGEIFGEPTVAGLAVLIADRGGAAELPAAGPVRRVLRDGPLALSFAQERVWFLEQLYPHNRAYRFHATLRFKGELQTPSLARALVALVRRHEVYRTTFPARGGRPVQRIHPSWRPPLPVIDLRRLTGVSREGIAQELLEREMARPFDLNRMPLARWTLVRLGPAENLLWHIEHHLVHDGWSFNLLLGELARLYSAFQAGEVSPLADLPVQFADFVHWQREWMEGEAAATQLAYWRERLADAPQGLGLPTDRPRPAVPSFRGAVPRIALPLDLCLELRSFVRRSRGGYTLFMVLLAAFYALLHRYSGRSDLALGSFIANRRSGVAEQIAGMIINTLVLRADLSDDPTGGEILARVRRTTLEAYAHQDLPFERIVDALSPRRELGRNPFFEVTFAIHDSPLQSLHFAGLETELLEGVSNGTAKFDLNVIAVPYREQRLGGDRRGAGEGITLLWEYASDLFDRATIDRMVGHYRHLLAALVEDSSQPLSLLPMMETAERREVLQAGRSARPTAAVEETLHRRFARQARRVPGAIAVVNGSEHLSYGELHRRAAVLAGFLADQGVGPESLVGLVAERSPELVVGILGVLAAGGAYLPFDPADPPERVAAILADARVRLCLTAGGSGDRALPAAPGATAMQVHLRLDEDWQAIAAAGCAPPPERAVPESLCYLLYTSGSTGAPKGVGVSHANVLRLFDACEAELGPAASDIWTLFHSAAFDFSVWELWGALLYGARLVVVPYWVSRSPDAFYDLLVEQRVTVLNQTPTAFRQLVAVDRRARVSAAALALRRVIFGGEALEPASLAPWFRRHGDRRPRLVNMYGITETTVHVTRRELGEADAVTAASRIGAPLPDLSLLLVDRAGQLVPIGVPGEIQVGGPGLARGYLGRPALTAERFIPDPYSGASGTRLYRSGDLGRRRPAGDLEYLGRIDRQVKVRGFRIELGEIERALLDHPGVEAAVAVVREPTPGDRRLTAYFVPDRESAHAVRRLLDLEREGAIAPEERCELPNGLSVVHLNRNETDFVYEEVFERRSYLRGGVRLGDGARVFDVGANIGLFTLFAARQARGVEVYAFEPIPAACERLRLNVALHRVAGRVFDCALGRSDGAAVFTYYPRLSILSGRLADPDAEREVVRRFVLDREPRVRGEVGEGLLDELIAERLASERVERPVRTLSAVIRELGIDRIDLLKVDVEKSEEDVLAGIAAEDWPKIQQAVVEVHDVDGRLRRIVELLEASGLRTVVEQDTGLAATGLYNVYGVRTAAGPPVPASPADGAAGWAGVEVLRDALRVWLEQRLPLHMVPVALVPLPALPLNRNNKLDERALPDPEAAPRRQRVPLTGELEHAIAEVWCQVLGIAEIGADDNFFGLGGDSILSILVVSRLSEQGIATTPKELFECQTVARLARVAAVGATRRERGPATGRVSLTPIQEWFFAQRLDEPHHFNQARLLAPSGGESRIDSAAAAAAIAALVEHHDALRLRFVREGEGWSQEYGPPPAEAPLETVAVETLEEGALAAATDRIQGELDLAHGPLLKAAVLRSPAADRLLLVAHHLVVDIVSWGILLHDLETALEQMAAARPVVLPPRTSSYGEWAEALRRLAERTERSELEYWLSVYDGAAVGLPKERIEERWGDVERVAAELSPARTRELLEGTGRTSGREVLALLLAALGRALGEWTGRPAVVITLEGHGREPLSEDLDLSRTVGWFTALYPHRLETGLGQPVEGHLARVREGLRRVPGRGQGWGLAYHLARRPELASLPEPELVFNYRGRSPTVGAQGRLTALAGPTGVARGPANRRPAAVNFECGVADGRLQLAIYYGRRRFDAGEMGSLAGRFLSELKGLLARQRRAGARSRSAADFPLAGLTEDQASALPAQVEDVYPLAPSQEGLLFHALMEPESAVYFEQARLELEGRLDPERYLGAWRRVVSEQPVLRTVFLTAEFSEPMQVVLKDLEPEVVAQDLRGFPRGEQEARVEAYCTADWQRTFALERGPLVRLALFRLGEARHRLVWSFHHLLLDGWSVSNVLAAVAAAYEGRETAAPPPFREFIAWLAGRDREASAAFWRRELAGYRGPLRLGWLRPEVEGGTRRVMRRERVLSRELSGRLEGFVRQRRVTHSSLMRAAWAVLLGRDAREEDVVFGATVSGRPAELPGVEGMVGPFLNAAPVRARLDAAGSLGELVEELHARSLAAREHEYGRLSEIQQLAGRGAAGELFDTLLIYENYPLAGRERPLGEARLVELRAREMTHYPLCLGAMTRESYFGFALIWAPERVEEAVVERLLGRLEALLERLVERPQASPWEIDLLTAAERAELVLRRRPPRRDYPLSFQQQDMYYQGELLGEVGLNHLSAAAELQGPLDVGLLRRALAAVVSCQAALRASFPMVDGRPVQRIGLPAAVECPLEDLSNLDAVSARQRLRRGEKALLERPYAMGEGPLLRFRLFRLATDQHYLVASFHHLILDMFFAAEMLRQVARAYQGLAAGDGAPAAAPAVGYGDFVLWQQARLSSGALETNRRYWARRLAGSPEPVQIPGGRAPSGARGLAVELVERRLPGPRLGQLKVLSRRLGSTPFELLASAFLSWLHRLTGEADLVVAVPGSTFRPELGEAVGMFSNTLPLRVDLSGDPRFEEVVGRVGQAMAGMVRHRSYPLTELLGYLGGGGGGGSRLPICMVQVGTPEARMGQVRLAGLPTRSGSSALHLLFVVVRTAVGIDLFFQYSVARFDRALVERLAASFMTLLEGLLSSPEASIGSLEQLDPRQRHHLLREVGRGRAARQGELAPRRIVRMAGARPEAVAATAGGEWISYGELAARSGWLAGWLGARGVGREVRVGVLGERGLGMLVSIVGILRSGAAFVPLDPWQPERRLRSMVAAAGLTWIVSDGSSSARALRLGEAPTPAPRVVCWDAATGTDAAVPWAAVAALAAAAPADGTAGQDLANVFYTSGSTGSPKGAMIDHRGMLNHLLAKVELLGLGPESVVVQNASHGFDISVWQFLAPLLAGGRVVIYGDPVALEPEVLLQRLERDGATVLETVPSLLQVMLDVLEGPAGAGLSLVRLRYLISNAETLPVAMARRWLRRVPAAVLVNTYGATECSDDTSHHRMVGDLPQGVERVAVGRPIRGLRIVIVDRYLRPLPGGVVGEVAMAGVGVGRGYLGEPARTAGCFVPDGLGADAGGRLYLTGDLGRWGENGALEFIGRIDQQVKVRGYRVEPGEVEAVLEAHPRIDQAVVVARDGQVRGTGLAGYWVGKEGLGEQELRRWLEQRLPAYMVPGWLLRLESMPLTRHGKVDRRAMPEPEETAGGGEGDVEPRGELETLIASVWEEVLGVERVGVHRRFFEVGGDSLASIRIAMRLRQEGLEVSVRDLFHHSTVAELAAALTRRQAAPPPARLAPGPQATPPQEATAVASAPGLPAGLDEAELEDLLDG